MLFVLLVCTPAWAALVQASQPLAPKLTGVVLQMTGENLDLNIGFRFVRVPNSDNVRRSQVKWHRHELGGLTHGTGPSDH